MRQANLSWHEIKFWVMKHLSFSIVQYIAYTCEPELYVFSVVLGEVNNKYTISGAKDNALYRLNISPK